MLVKMADVVKKFIRKGKASVSTKYSRLAQQDASGSEDEEDEDDILFIHDGLRDNGFTRINMPQANGQRDNIELKNLRGRSPKSDLDTIQKRPWSQRRKLIFVLSVILCVFVTLICVFAIPWNDLCCGHGQLNLPSEDGFNSTVFNTTDMTEPTASISIVQASTASPVLENHQATPSKKPGGHNSNYKRTDPWQFSRKGFASESCVRLVDVDQDGKDDIIIGSGRSIDYRLVKELKEPAKICERLGLESPCLGHVTAIRGSDGHVLWNITISAEMFLFDCESIDINKDGMKDCVGAGRMGTMIAFNPKNGHIFWTESTLKDMLNRAWNIYQPLILNKDLNGDGVLDVVIAHGGEPTFRPQEHNRHAGRLILMSGKTGEPFGHYLEMPNSKETYMSPILHVNGDRAYILFGSGGETIPGGFLAISVDNLHKHALQKDIDGTHWGSFQPDSDGIIEIYKSKTKGIMVPPVLVDMNNDGIRDILMVSFDGTYILYDGKSLDIMWHRDIKGYESYSTPAPGYFNDDDVLDFMTHISPGSWPHYDYSVVLVLDGKDGSVLWQMASNHYDMTSDLILKTKEHNRDVFIFRVQGREGPNYDNPTGVFHDVISQRPINDGRMKRATHPDLNNPYAFAGVHAKHSQGSKIPLNVKEGGQLDGRQGNPYGNYYGDTGNRPRYQGDNQGMRGQAPAANPPQNGQYVPQQSYNSNRQRNQPYSGSPSNSRQGPQIRLPGASQSKGRQMQGTQNVPDLSRGSQPSQQNNPYQGYDSHRQQYPIQQGQDTAARPQSRQHIPNIPNIPEGGHFRPQQSDPVQGDASDRQQYPVQHGPNQGGLAEDGHKQSPAQYSPFAQGVVEGGTNPDQQPATDSQSEDLQKLAGAEFSNPPDESSNLAQKVQKEEEERKHKAEMECHRNKLSYKVEVFAMDRTTMHNPLIIDSMDMYTYDYNLTKEDMLVQTDSMGMTPEDLDIERKRFNYGPFCSIVHPKEITTGAIGDVDGDGLLDLVLLVVYSGFTHAEDGSYIQMIQDMKLYKINLEEKIRFSSHMMVNVTVSAKMPEETNEKAISSLEFLQEDKQSWSSYMGKKDNGAYSP